MFFVDTHTHLYLEEFDVDGKEVILRALASHVGQMVLPSIDHKSIQRLKALCNQFPNSCFPTAGLHPTSVNETFMNELTIVEQQLKTEKNYAIGETGIDLYWNQTFRKEQEYCFKKQLEWAATYKLPIIIHARNALNEILTIIKNFKAPLPKGVFHCFPGNFEEAKLVVELGFLIGIGGVVTFKNSAMTDLVQKMPLEHFVLETDAPYLAPMPFRGKRNQPSYIPIIAQKIAALKNISIEKVAEITTKNAQQLFLLPPVN